MLAPFGIELVTHMRQYVHACEDRGGPLPHSGVESEPSPL